MNTNGPYYEISFIKINEYKNETTIINFIESLKNSTYNIELLEENNTKNKIEKYCNGENIDIELDININICGIKSSKIYIEYLSDEMIQIDFCFDEEIIEKNEMEKLRELLKYLIVTYNGIVGMIGWETVCNMIFFDTKKAYPNKNYSIKNIKQYTNKDIYQNNQKWLNGVEEIIWNENINM